MHIRRVRPADEAELAKLLMQMEKHYRDETPTAAAASLATHLVSAAAGATHTLAADMGDGTLHGFAICNEYWPAGHLTKGFFLKDLFVDEAARSNGTGRKMLDHIAALARELGCSRVHWTTGEANTGAQRLYDAIGARREKKVNYVVEGELLGIMAERARRDET